MGEGNNSLKIPEGFSAGILSGFQKRRESFPDRFSNFLLALGRWVNAIGLIEIFDSTDPIEEEGEESGFRFRGDIGKDLLEFLGKLWPHIVGHLHAGDDQTDVRVFGACLCDHPEQVFLAFGGRDTAESIVPAEGNDEDVRPAGKSPVDPAKATRGGVTADPGVGDNEGKAGGLDLLLDHRWIGSVRVQPIAGGDAVAKDDDSFLGIICKRGGFVG